jgi:hypothetical protein
MIQGKFESQGWVLWCPKDMKVLESFFPAFSKKTVQIDEPLAYRCSECSMIIIPKTPEP